MYARSESSSTGMTCKPPRLLLHPPPFHNCVPGNNKKRVLNIMHQCNTQGFPSNLHDIKLTRPEGESHTAFCPCSCKRGLPKKSAGSYQTQPRLLYEPIAASHSGFTTNQTAKWHHRKSLLLSVGPLHQNWFTPPKNRVFFHGWFEEAQVCYVFRANGP